MNPNHVISLIQADNFYFVKVTFAEKSTSKTYHYKVPKSLPLVVGDLVVVKTNLSGSNGYGGYTVAKVVEVINNSIIDVSSDVTYRWIVSKVDTTLFFETLKTEEELTERLKVAEYEAMRKRVVDAVNNSDFNFFRELKGPDTTKRVVSEMSYTTDDEENY